jgi:hypothetical protein
MVRDIRGYIINKNITFLNAHLYLFFNTNITQIDVFFNFQIT